MLCSSPFLNTIFLEATTNCFIADDMAFASQIIDEVADCMTLLNKAQRDFGTVGLEVDGGTYVAEQVVIATGPFQAPFVPPIAGELDAEVVQLHSTDYRSPKDIPAGAVLVVGGGNTGFQIAEELSRSHEVHLSIGSRQTPLPQRILGRDLFWYLEGTGLLRKSLETRIGRRLSGRETLIGSSPRRARRRHGVQLHKRAVDASGRTVSFADGETSEACHERVGK